MVKKVLNENQLRNIIRNVLSESFASNSLKREIMNNGGIKKIGQYYEWNGKDSFLPFGGIIDKLTDEDLIYRSMHLNEYNQTLTIICKNDEELVIPISGKEDDEISDKRRPRRDYSKYDDGKYYYQPETEKYSNEHY